MQLECRSAMVVECGKIGVSWGHHFFYGNLEPCAKGPFKNERVSCNYALIFTVGLLLKLSGVCIIFTE